MEEADPPIEIVHSDIECSLLKDPNYFSNSNEHGDPRLSHERIVYF